MPMESTMVSRATSTELPSALATPWNWAKNWRLEKSKEGKMRLGKPETSAGEESALTMRR